MDSTHGVPDLRSSSVSHLLLRIRGKLTTVLGINAYHGDSSSCLVIDGQVICAAEEERFNRVKHWAGFPQQSIRYCLEEANLTVPDIDFVAINQDTRANMGRRLAYVAKSRISPKTLQRRLQHRRKRSSIPELLSSMGMGQFSGELRRIEHHRAHVASAFYVSPFKEATVVSLDGFGDFASCSWGRGQGNNIELLGRVYYPHSLGVFYQALTQWLGFPNYGDEYKVMGLAPYGEPELVPKIQQLVHTDEQGLYRLNLDFFYGDNEPTFDWNDGPPIFGPLYSKQLEDLLGPARSPDEPLTDWHRDVARSTQHVFEEAVFAFLNGAHKAAPSDNLAYAGGCAMNSVANGKIRRHTPFKNVYLPAAAGDAGGAIGAALSVWTDMSGARPSAAMDAYWGPGYGHDYIRALLDVQAPELEAEECTVEYVGDQNRLSQLGAEAIADGLVVGWFQGRMEWGPRALGNRSILCDPRNANMKAVLNDKIKRRESFRPFAPSILRERVSEWFEQEDDVPFMMQVFDIKPDQQHRIPAVTHVDGTGRLHTVTEEANPRYATLIAHFEDLTGVPIVLNTSFNENEPVVCTPEEALATFLRTRMDRLFLNDWILSRN